MIDAKVVAGGQCGELADIYVVLVVVASAVPFEFGSYQIRGRSPASRTAASQPPLSPMQERCGLTTLLLNGDRVEGATTGM